MASEISPTEHLFLAASMLLSSKLPAPDSAVAVIASSEAMA